MAITFDPSAKRIVLVDTTTVSASQLWVAWIDWVSTGDNSKYLPALSQVGGNTLGSGLSIPPYIFLLNGWRVRPMEQDHDLSITGNLFVEGGGTPVVRTLGPYQVNVSYVVPVQAQGISTAGAVAAPAAYTPQELNQKFLDNAQILNSIVNKLNSINIPSASDIRQELDTNSSKLKSGVSKVDLIALM